VDLDQQVITTKSNERPANPKPVKIYNQIMDGNTFVFDGVSLDSHGRVDADRGEER
jgi:hypothetical protein